VLTLVLVGVRIYLNVTQSHSAAGPKVLTAEGFPGDNKQPPEIGSWGASGLVVSAAGYGGAVPGARETRFWEIHHACLGPGISGGECRYTISREILGPRGGVERPLTAILIPEPDGWHATFPTREYVCGTTDTRPIYWTEHFSLVLRFTDHGKEAEANGRDFSYEPRCGYGTQLVRWKASRMAETYRIGGSGLPPAPIAPGL
jgi:hypothetical protein